ncbi:hypothetical protein M406DRAFT_49715 [Cryphonectria parasitica EP155]|uniref:FAD-binding PCMH-type domain-containing protein n=1 Tax=Cryphonectria parasitica (strain ATCC 38755 / EP155) TaxID=660469 RepID=A0A9P4XVY0_CRYP1|nr:uncharacterized protein M406DRAFT_49715 [Cryphonectria parasitica EP155]KAF3761755.1 hypothetical protein M406DRAFT_49715 [Cryphonectria parasitica EP155]
MTSSSPSTTTPSTSPEFPIQWRESTPRDEFLASCWSHNHNHRRATSARVPRAVVHATSPSHVVEAVKLAGKLGCRVSVRSGGHSWAGWSVRDDAVLIDLGALPGGKHSSSSSSGATTAGLDYDDRTKIVSAPPSATGRMVNGFLEKHGRMFAGGHCPDVGLGGFLLQGGMGWNCKNWGWACESIIGLDAVTAEGKEVYASKGENADLFWAARGAGPGFPAIVTRFYLMTRPLPKMSQSIYFWPKSIILSHCFSPLWKICPDADPDTEIVCLGQYIPGYDEPIVFANFLSFKPTQAEAEAALRPLHDHPGRPPNALKESFFAQPTSLPGQYVPQEAANPPDHRYCSENAYIRNNEADVPAVLEKAFTTVPNRKTFALYFSMNPTSRRGHYSAGVDDVGSMAFSMQSDHYFALYSIWEDEKDDEKFVGWTHDIMKDVERHAEGSYLGDADFQLRRTKFWRDENAARLMEIRRKWDPDARICGYLDEGDRSGAEGLRNEFEWK